MRPVTKRTPTAQEYPYPVDVSSQPLLNASLNALAMDFSNFMLAPEIEDIWGSASPTALEVLNGLLLLADDAPPAAAGAVAPDAVKAVKKSLTDKLNTWYIAARRPLEEQIGRFCSYCERYEGSAELQVEHICPKSAFPLFYFAWDNFLFSCGMCNTLKGTRPTRADVGAQADEAGYFAAVKQTYLWPQWSNTAYRDLRPVLEHRSAAGWRRVAFPEDPRNRMIEPHQASRTVTADAVVLGGTVLGPGLRLNFTKVVEQRVPVRVTFEPTTDEAREIVDLMHLNDDSDATDLRMFERTECWYHVMERVRDLRNQTTAADFRRSWDLMMGTVKQPGFYSVWVAVIELLGRGRTWQVPGTATLVMDLFLEKINDQAFFPGTNTANTP